MSLADIELKDFEADLTCEFQGHTYPVYVLMEYLLMIVDKNARLIPFTLNRQQIALYKEICYQKRENRPVRINILKGRQIGFSTFIAGLYFILALFTPHLRVGIVADVEKHAGEIFSKYETFYRYLDHNNPNKKEIEEWELLPENKNKIHPLSYKPVLASKSRRKLIQTLYGNSSIEVVVAGDNAGRSANYHLLHLSECAFFENLKLTLNGLLETVSSNNKNSFIFLETTANGFNEYKDRFDKDLSGATAFKAFFVPWFANPEYCEEEYNNSNLKMPLLENWVYEKQETYKLSNGQIMWFWHKYQDKGDKQLTLQEYPFSVVDAFLTSGNCIFDEELLAKRKEEIIAERESIISGQFTYQPNYSLDGSQIKLTDVEFVQSRNGLIKIYQDAIPGHHYVGVCDPNDEGSDYSAVQIIDNCTGEQVACFQTRELTHDKVAFQFYLLGKKYNNALLSNEMNRGRAIMDYLLKLSYPKLYIDQEPIYDSMKQSYKTRYGHRITKSSRPVGIESLKIAFKENPRMINDFDTICEMETFINRERSYMGKTIFKIEASGSNHDDLVMALVGYYLVRNQQSFIVSKKDSYQEKMKNLEMFRESKKPENRNKNFYKYTGIKF